MKLGKANVDLSQMSQIALRGWPRMDGDQCPSSAWKLNIEAEGRSLP